MPKIQGKCIFCGGYGLSKEHVFADWLREIFPRSNKDTHTLGRLQWEGAASEKPRFLLDSRQGHSGSRKVRMICLNCNRGWLSRLEEAAKGALVPLIRGRSVTITPSIQTLLATWAVKTSIVAEKLERKKAVVPASVHKWLMDSQTVPPGYSVHIAPYAGLHWPELALHQFIGLLDLPAIHAPREGRSYLEVTAIGMGHLFILVIGTSITTHIFWEGILDHMHRIHPEPFGLLSWPSGKVFSDLEANFAATCGPRGTLVPLKEG